MSGKTDGYHRGILWHLIPYKVWCARHAKIHEAMALAETARHCDTCYGPLHAASIVAWNDEGGGYCTRCTKKKPLVDRVLFSDPLKAEWIKERKS